MIDLKQFYQKPECDQSAFLNFEIVCDSPVNGGSEDIGYEVFEF